MKTLPSEIAQDLAEYLRQQEDNFLIHFPGEGDLCVDQCKLAQTIQDYWDSLDEHN